MKEFFSNFKFVFNTIRKYAKSYFYLSNLYVLISSAEPIINVLFVKIVIDSIMQNKTLENLFVIIIGMLLFVAIYTIIVSIYKNYFSNLSKIKIQNALKIDYYKRIKNIDLECYDDPEYYNKSVRLLQESINRYIAVFENFLQFLSQIIISITIIGIISTLGWEIMVFGIFFIILNLIITTRNNKIIHEKSIEQMQETRVDSYINRVFFMKDFAKDIRFFPNLSNILINKFNKSASTFIRKEKVFGKKISVNNILQGVLSYGYFCFLLGYLGYEVISGKITIGSFSALVAAGQSFNQCISGLFNIIPSLMNHNIYLKEIINFNSYSSRISVPKNPLKIPEKVDLTISNLSFSYPHTEEKTLNNLNIKVPFGKKIAIVGKNGAGKSTLLKLILRLYDPTEGTIKINDNDYSCYDSNEIRSCFSVVFQDTNIYALNVAQNVLMDSIDNREADVIDALNNVGMKEKIDKSSEKGIFAELTKEFDDDGINLSGGEIQKIAIARAFAGNSKILIFDEPNSSLDPLSEYEIFENIAKCSENKSVLVISHKLSLIKNFDYIYLIDNGTVLEEGTHDQLMDNNKLYAEMYRKQSKKYQ